VPVSIKSAFDITATGPDAVLLVASGSLALAGTPPVTMLLITPVAAKSTMPVTMNVAAPPAGRSTVVDSGPLPEDVAHAAPLPGVHVHWMLVSVGANASVTVAAVTGLGP